MFDPCSRFNYVFSKFVGVSSSKQRASDGNSKESDTLGSSRIQLVFELCQLYVITQREMRVEAVVRRPLVARLTVVRPCVIRLPVGDSPVVPQVVV